VQASECRPLQLLIPVACANDIRASITEDGSVSDRASEDFRAARQRVSAIENRLKGLLQKYGGEVTSYKVLYTTRLASHIAVLHWRHMACCSLLAPEICHDLRVDACLSTFNQQCTHVARVPLQ
jgi:hypothetical protein